MGAPAETGTKDSTPGATDVAIPRMPRPTATAPSTKKPTIYDVARAAEVSPGTVSRVLNNREKVHPETRERVLRAARDLNLRPQVAVRMRQVAILSEPTFTDRIEGYAATLMAHLAFAFSRRNIGVVLPSNPFEQLPSTFLDGVVAVTYDTRLSEMLAGLERQLPVVYMDKFNAGAGQYRVCSDHCAAGYLAAQYFVARGKKRVGFLSGDAAPFVERLRGYRRAIEDAKRVPDEELFVLLGPHMSHAAAVARLVRAGVDAIYVPGTSFQAMEVLHVLTYVMGLRVPQDVSLIGGENDGISALQNPPLTTIEEPLREMAEQAVAMLDRLTCGEAVAARQLTLPVRLLVRDSVS